MKTLTVALPGREYNIQIGRGRSFGPSCPGPPGFSW